MKASLLYKIFLIGLACVILIMMTLWKIEPSLAPTHPQVDTAPLASALTEVEFESGARALSLKAFQEKRLHSYQGTREDNFVEVPLERAIDVYLEEKQ